MAEGPDFIGVGVQKSGTTWAARRLAEHPQVFLRKKEVSFFTQHFHEGYGWYHALFKDKGDRLAGEISPNYFISPRRHSTRVEHYPRWSFQSWWKHLTRTYPSARDEIRKSYPGIKVFAIFRNPVDRAWSHYWMWAERRQRVGKGHLVVPFERMFRDNGRWIQDYGRYGTWLKHWLAAFPDMGIFLYDDLVADAAAFIRSIYRFIGVDETFPCKLGSREFQGKYEPMDAATRQRVADFYRDEVAEFSRLIGRTLPWLE